MKRIILILFVVLLWFGNIRAELQINELMQSNIDCIMDDLNEFPDSWVELYNAGNQTINLSNYSIGSTAVSSWSLSSVNVPPRAFAIIYCDKAATGLHTDFRLDSGKGGNIFLLRKGVVVDSLMNIPKQAAPNVSYGRQKEGSASWGWQAVPTPGAANCGKLLSKVLGHPIFSVPGQVFTHSGKTALALSLPSDAPQGTVIRYTLNGSEPDEQSTLYTDTIFFPVSTIVRARLFCDGWLSPRSATQSYIYLKRDMTLPVVSVVSDPDYFFDSKIGIYTDGNYAPNQSNYNYDWRRPVNIEFFFTPDSAGINQLCETRVQGGAQRGHAIHSLAIYANKRFGTKRFNYEFFPDQRPGVTDFKSLILRNAGNDFHGLYMRDAICQRMAATWCDLDWQAWRPAVFFINGQYRGIVNIRERSNEDNIYTNYNGLEDIVMVENRTELKSGSREVWDEFVNFYSTRGHSLEEYQKVLDVDEYLNAMVLNLFINNEDFPGNNLILWRPSKEGGKWRILLKDLDFGLGLDWYPASTNTLEWFYTPGYDPYRNWANSSGATRLFRYAMENADFRNLFVDRAVVYIGDFLNHGRTWEIWKPMHEMIETEYPYHKARCNISANYDETLQFARTWLQSRPLYFIQQLRDKYSLGDFITMSVNLGTEETVAESMDITLNNLPLTRGKWQGRWFLSRPVSLWCRQARGWKVSYKENNTQKELSINGQSCELTLPSSWSNVSIQAVLSSTDLDLTPSVPEVRKFIRNGQLFIVRDGKTYNALGTEVR